MAEIDFTNIAAGSIATPGSGVSALFVDSTSKLPQVKNDAGGVALFPCYLLNRSVSTPAAGFASDTYLVGSSIAIPAGYPRVGTIYRVRFDITKTAAGIATPIFTVRIGTLGTVADSARLTFTFAAQTAAIDTGWLEITSHFRTVGSGSSAVMVGTALLSHALAATGLTSTGASGQGQLNVISGGFDSTVASSIIGLSVNGGASAAWTINLVQSEFISP